MNPYKSPESDLTGKAEAPPRTIFIVYCLLWLSFIIFLVEQLIYALYSETGIYDVTNYFFVPLWAFILYWVAGSIRNRQKNPKNTFLMLALIVAGLTIYAPIGPYSIYTGLAEACCFLIVYLLLSKKSLQNWFE